MFYCEGDFKGGERGESEGWKLTDGFSEFSGNFVWMGRVDGGEFMVQGSCAVFVFVVCFVVEEGDEEFGSGCLGWFKSFMVFQSLCWSVL